jgi:predicted kinase
MSKVIFIIRGLPASGKSTFAQAWVAERPDERARVNRDDIRFNTFGRYVLPNDLEMVITKIEHATIAALLRAGKSVIIDNTNLRAKNVKPYLIMAKEAGAEVIHRDFPVELDELLRRNNQRARKVDEAYIQKVYKNFTRRGSFGTFPTLDEEVQAEAAARYIPDETLPAAWIVDVDGTLADIIPGGRSPYDFTRVLEDEVHEHVARLVRMLHAQGKQILITSGRSDASQADTEVWLQANDIPYDYVFMRKDGDSRKDSIIKREIFDEHIRQQFNVEGVLDDRLQVSITWHQLGLPLFRVGDPQANF